MRQQLAVLGLVCIGCTPHDDVFMDDGFGVDGDGRCLEVDVGIVNLGTFPVSQPPQSKSVFIDNICGDTMNDIDWQLDDPAGVFSVEAQIRGTTLVLDVQTNITEIGDWEAQISIQEPFQDTTHFVQVFAESHEDAPSSDE